MVREPWILSAPGTAQVPRMLNGIGEASLLFAPDVMADLNVKG
jgi:hypothetical protein